MSTPDPDTGDSPFREALASIHGTSWLNEAARSSLRAADSKFFGKVAEGDSDYIELVGDDLPSHLRADAPFATCLRCGRKTWDDSQFGKECRMTQPDGFPCGGMFTDPRAS